MAEGGVSGAAAWVEREEWAERQKTTKPSER